MKEKENNGKLEIKNDIKSKRNKYKDNKLLLLLFYFLNIIFLYYIIFFVSPNFNADVPLLRVANIMNLFLFH